MAQLFVVLILGCFLASGECTGCDRDIGPADESKCTIDPSTTNNEWSICMANDYLWIMSGGADRCTDGASYCWRSCSVENPTLGCTCTQNATVPPDPALPAWCYNPSGTACNWYRECLNVKHPCEDSEYDYALSFGEHFCTAYDKTFHSFSKTGQEWIDSVRRCLQVVLVPQLRDWLSPTCKELQEKAFESHTGCYVSPGPGASSICSLGMLDWWRVFWTIKEAFISDTYQSIKGFLETAVNGCLNHMLSWDMPHHSAIMKLEITLPTDTDHFAQEVVNGIAREQQWDGSTLDWFAYVPHSNKYQQLESTHDNMFILLGDRAGMGLTKATNIKPTDLDALVKDFANTVKMGELKDLKLSHVIKIWSLKVCKDFRCTDSCFDEARALAQSQSFKYSVLLFSLSFILLSKYLINM